MRRIALTFLALASLPRAARSQEPAPRWLHGATCYEVFVRSFFDSNGDGVGDLNGLTSKLDYIKGLGVRCIWLMPVAESPSYHGYDVSNYYKVEPAYGTNDDFKRMVAAAHQRGLKIIVDMVLNHSSDRHPYFQAAIHDTTSPYRSWYIFSKTDGGKGPWGAPAWHKSPVYDEYYYGIFYSGMPDLNYNTPAVRAEGMKIADFWTKQMGVDGFRLDAVQYLMEDGPCLKDCVGTHQYLREYGKHLHAINPNTYAVGEVWDPVDTLLTYYPDQLTSYFTFAPSDSLLWSVKRDTVGGLLDTYLRLQSAIPDQRYGTLQRNHDETRTLTILGGDLVGARLSVTLLLTLPGEPYVYYGEELGMSGDKPDPRLRTPMQWTGSTGGGFTTGTPWETLQSDSATANVAVQDTVAGSLLNLYRKLIHLRATNEALAEGKLVALTSGDPGVAAYLRRARNHTVMVVVNLATSQKALSITSAAGAVSPGSYWSLDLMTNQKGARFAVGQDGHLNYSLTVPARGSVILELVRRN
ncbi:MAG TPA: alpha-amylase family glycosyl hydrolase [Gemmatimonadales bacterium]|nr:alpha-amylase family glycosyl hydrolase [Gemmatimonadales bacterium]